MKPLGKYMGRKRRLSGFIALMLFSAVSAITLLLYMEGAAAAGPCPGGGNVGECWTSWVNCAEDCDECWFKCRCCLAGGWGYWDGPFAKSDCTSKQKSCAPPPCTPSCASPPYSDVCDESASDGCGGTCTRDTDGISCGANQCVGTEAQWNFRCSGGTCTYDSLRCSCGCSGAVCKNPDTDQGSCEVDCSYTWMVPREFLPSQEAQCCGDDTARERYDTCRIGAGGTIAWAGDCTSGDDACCTGGCCVDPVEERAYTVISRFRVGWNRGVGAFDVTGEDGGADDIALCARSICNGICLPSPYYPDGWFDCDYNSTACGMCGKVAAWPNPGCAAGGCWVRGGESAAFGEYDTGTATECCGDDASERYLNSSYSSSIEEAVTQTRACCDAATDCVNGSLCYSNGSRALVDGNGDNDICLAGTWYDCAIDADCSAGKVCDPLTRDCECGSTEAVCDDGWDNDCDGATDEWDIDCGPILCPPPNDEANWFILGETGCDRCSDGKDNDGDGLFDLDDPDCCAECEKSYQFDSNAPGPETPVGCGSPFLGWELGGGFQQQWCCGNNATTEFYKNGYGFEACCNASTDCVDGDGTCRIGGEYSPGGCTDPDDHDCDGKNNYNDPDCRANISGKILYENGTIISGVNVTIIAGATDPVTQVYVEFTTTTDNGSYSLEVIVNLAYNIVAHIPGIGIGYWWDFYSDGDDNLNITVRTAAGCETDCTLQGENTCRPECQGMSGCDFDSVMTMQVCDGSQAGWFVPYNATFQVQCCVGIPSLRTQARIVGVRGARDVARVTRIVSYGGQLITLVIDVFQ